MNLVNLDDLYQDVILDHGRKPRNFGPLPMANREAEGYNPFCGDHVHVRILFDDGVIREIKFEGAGCAISTASASLMTQSVKGKTLAEAKALFDGFHDSVVGTNPIDEEKLGSLVCLCGVRDYPNRIKCATLAWHALIEALEGAEEPQAKT